MRYFHHGALGLACILLLTACGKPPDRVEITNTAERSEHQPVPRVTATSEERFAYALPKTAPLMRAGSAQQATGAASPFAYHTPEGWTEVAPTQFRNPNFLAGRAGEVECYVSVLAGNGGGLLVNANRWRGQMGQGPFTEEEFAEQTRTVILDHEAVIVDFEGAFSGMGQAAPKEGYRLIGALVETSDSSVFIKMVGPKDAVEAQKDYFTHFAQTLRFKDSARVNVAQDTGIPESGELPPDHPDISGRGAAVIEAPTRPSSEGGLKWEVPDGWEEVKYPSPMRLVTLAFGPGNLGECYVVVLSGSGGGRLNNMNRWLGQMGEPPLEESELDLKPRIELLGEQVPMLIARGTYTGMGGQSLPGHVLLGATAELDDRSIFIKLIAPEQLLNGHWDNFIAFCGSIEVE
jgi:hypothetical protein